MAISYSIPATGTLRSNLPTPALTIDLNALEDNLACMARFFEDKPARLRPHFKTHKCPILAHRQIRAGAIGMTCAKLGEAEVLVEAGIGDILIANQIVDPAKIGRLAELARQSRLIVAVDQADNLRQFGLVPSLTACCFGQPPQLQHIQARLGDTVLAAEPVRFRPGQQVCLTLDAL